MKPLSLLILTLFCTIGAKAQPWIGPVPGNIYYNQGNVGIGTASPGAILHIGGSQISQYSSMIINNTQTNLGGGSIRSGLLISANTTNTVNNIDMVDGLIIASPILTSGGGTFQNLRGITIHEQTGASRNTDLLIGTTGNYLTPGSDFAIYSASFRNSYFAGNIGIGTTTPGNKLDVNGTIRAIEVKVESGWADYVFDQGYNLQDLSEVELYINKHKHLPDVPDSKEVEKNGVNLGEMNALLLKKIEELTLYAIEQNKKIETLEKTVNNLIAK